MDAAAWASPFFFPTPAHIVEGGPDAPIEQQFTRLGQMEIDAYATERCISEIAVGLNSFTVAIRDLSIGRVRRFGPFRLDASALELATHLSMPAGLPTAWLERERSRAVSPLSEHSSDPFPLTRIAEPGSLNTPHGHWRNAWVLVLTDLTSTWYLRRSPVEALVESVELYHPRGALLTFSSRTVRWYASLDFTQDLTAYGLDLRRWILSGQQPKGTRGLVLVKEGGERGLPDFVTS